LAARLMLETAPMTRSANLAIPYLAPAQAQKHVTVNEALRKLDAIVQLSVVSATTTAQPASPADGAVYILPAGKTGAAWAAMAVGSLAYFRDGAWEEIIPKLGWRAFDHERGRMLTFLGAGTWTSLEISTPFGSGLGLAILEEELTLSGASAIASVAVIPNRAIVLAVSCRTTAQITGAASYDCGIAGEQSKFGGSLGVAVGSTNIGVVGPQAFYSPTPIQLTANGAPFVGGRVRVAVQYIAFAAPAA